MSPSSYNLKPWELSELQKQIILHIFNCKEEIESVSHIATVLNKKQPSVQRSIDQLVSQHYIAKDPVYVKRKKVIVLTEQGSFTAVYLGANFDELINKTDLLKKNNIQRTEFWEKLKIIFPNTEKRNSYTKKAIEYYFKNDLFEAGDVKKEWNQEQINNMKFAQFQIAKEHFESIGLEKYHQNLREFLKEYKIEKEPLKEYLLKQKEHYEKALKELED